MTFSTTYLTTKRTTVLTSKNRSMNITHDTLNELYFSDNNRAPYILVSAVNAMAARRIITEIHRALKLFKIPHRVSRHHGWRYVSSPQSLEDMRGHVHYVTDGSVIAAKHAGKWHEANLHQERYYERTKFYRALVDLAARERAKNIKWS